MRFPPAIHAENLKVLTMGRKLLFLSPGNEENLGGW